MQTANGLAAVAINPNQNTATAPMIESANTPRPSPDLTVRHTSHVKTESIRPHNTTLPSSAAQPAAKRKMNGVRERGVLCNVRDAEVVQQDADLEERERRDSTNGEAVGRDAQSFRIGGRISRYPYALDDERHR